MISPRPLSMPSFVRRFRTTGAVTLFAVYLLILIGGIVRGTGAGMGCPDWPRCFGRWVPPTSVAELPADYIQTYRDGRIAKNQKVAQRLDRMGFHGLAENIFRHPDSFIETDFNVTKTWIEYVNRLVGAVIGLLILLTFRRSLDFWQRDRVVPLVAGLAVLTVGVQGWLGSLVVSTNLVPALVTWHMALALGLLILLHYAHARTGHSDMRQGVEAVNNQSVAPSFSQKSLLVWGLVALTFGQIILGTQVREGIDRVAAELNYLNRDLWVSRLGFEFSLHRAYSTLLLMMSVVVSFQVWQLNGPFLSRLVLVMNGLLLLNISFGVALAKFAMPAWLQPLHLLVATLLFGAQVMLALYVRAPVPLTSMEVASVAQAQPQVA